MAKRNTKQVVLTAEDGDIVDYLEEKGVMFSTYVKQLIREDMFSYETNSSNKVISRKLDTVLALLEKGAGRAAATPAPKATSNISDGSRKAAAAMMGTFGVKGGK